MVKKDNLPLYMIGVAAKLSGIHPQTLRIYESKELIIPKRTAKNTRLYSNSDIDTIKYIQKLTQQFGINLAGVKAIIDLENEVKDLQDKMRKMEEEMDLMEKQVKEKIRKIHQSYKFEIEPYSNQEIEIKRK